MIQRRSLGTAFLTIMLSLPLSAGATDSDSVGRFVARGAAASAGVAAGCVTVVMGVGLVARKHLSSGSVRDSNIVNSLCVGGMVAGGGAAWKAADHYLNDSPSEQELQSDQPATSEQQLPQE
jgi:succinate dehydrogenase/fumarate reductase flavoprotein subunit